jgi:hypothetical protein
VIAIERGGHQFDSGIGARSPVRPRRVDPCASPGRLPPANQCRNELP